MLNLNEYNESLYKALDKKNRKKNMVENYGQFLMHAKKTSGVTNLPDKTWLTDEVRGAVSEAYKVLNKKSMQVDGSNDPSVIYDACRGEISVLAKLIRKANAGGLDSSYITQLNNYRNELESRAEEARSAMSRENQGSKVARHSEEAGEALEHGEKWRKHKYIRIENGRYIYPEDLEKMGKQNTYLNNMAKKEKAAGDAQKAFQNNPTKENYGNWNIALKERKQTKDAMKLQADVKKAENAEKAARDAQQKANYEKNKAAAEAMSQNNQKNSTVVKNQQQSNYEKNKAAAEAMAQKQQANSTVVKKTKDAVAKIDLKANQNAREEAVKKSQRNTVIDNLGTLMGKLETEYHKAFDKGDTEAGKKGWDKYFKERDKFMEEHDIEFGSPEYQEACKIADKMWEKYQKSIFHSSFSISDEEMEAFLAHKAN